MKNKEIQLNDIWTDEKRKSLSEFILSNSEKQTKERKIKNELLAIKFQIEDYINSNYHSDKLQVLDFVKLYLKTFNVTQRKLAELFEMQDSNLYKYLIGERKLNAHLVLKLSSFSHLSPEYWLRIEVKNELIEINNEIKKNKDYKKYDYKNLLVTTED
jgi:plasmid maintenance system antidote protein VapI